MIVSATNGELEVVWMTSSMLQLLIFESCPAISAGLRSIVESREDMHIASETRFLDEAFLRLRTVRHDLIIMSLRPGLREACSVVGRLLLVSKGTKILVLGSQGGDGEILQVLDAGAAGYILKSASREEIVETILRVASRDRYLPPVIAQQLADYIGRQPLTPREVEVLGYVREGWRNRQIAQELRLAETTVNFHVKNTLSKLRANDRTHAVTIAIKRGLLPVMC